MVITNAESEYRHGGPSLRRPLLLALILCLVLAGWFLLWSLIPDTKVDEYEFSVLGDSLRNLGGVAAVAVASTAAYIAYQTNEARRIEANRSNFKDRMQWVVSHIESGQEAEQILAVGILESLSEDEELEESDRKLVLRVAISYEEELDDEVASVEAKENKVGDEDNFL